MVDNASKFIFGFPFPTMESMGLAKAVLIVILISGLSVSLCSYPNTDFTAKGIEQGLADERVY